MYAPDVPIIRRDGHRWMESFLVILDRRGCPKACPYCTAEITDWPKGDDRLERLPPMLDELHEAGTRFEWLTISGNGEPSLYPVGVLRQLRESLDAHPELFVDRRFQSSGELFFRPDAFEIFHDYVMELTRVHVDPDEDMRILRYRRDHTKTETYAGAQIGLNHVLLRSTFGTLLDDLERYRDEIGGRLQSLTLKILNVDTRADERTRTGRVQSEQSRWIQEHALLGEDADRVIERVSTRFAVKKEYDPVLDRVVWDLGNEVPLILVTKRERYGRLHVVFHEGRLIDYALREIPINDLR